MQAVGVHISCCLHTVVSSSLSSHAQGWDISFATPRHSPSRHHSFTSADSSMCESPPLKLPRLFTPPPPSPAENQLRTPLDFELSPTPRGPPLPFRDTTNTAEGDDVMIFSPPKIERLHLFDYPATPQTLARGSSMLAKESFLNRLGYI